jgi:hypothetical protein
MSGQRSLVVHPTSALETHVKVVLGVPDFLFSEHAAPTGPTLIDRLVSAEHEHAQDVLVADPFDHLRDDASQPILDPRRKDVQPLGGLFQRGFLVKRLASLVRGQGSLPTLAELVGYLDELDMEPVAFALFTGLVARESALNPRGGRLDVALARGRPDLVRRRRLLVLGILGGSFLLVVVVVIATVVLVLVVVMLVLLVVTVVVFGLEELVKLGRLEHVDDLDGLLSLVRLASVRRREQVRVGRSDGLTKSLRDGQRPSETSASRQP